MALILICALSPATRARACGGGEAFIEVLRWQDDGALLAVLAPRGDVVRIAADGSIEHLGRTWASRGEYAALRGTDTIVSLRATFGATRPGCLPQRWSLRSGPLLGRPRLVRSWRPDDDVFGLTVSPLGQRAIVTTAPVLDGPTQARVVSTTNGQELARALARAGVYWTSDSEFLAVSDDETTLLRHAQSDGWQGHAIHRAPDGLILDIIVDASGALVLWEYDESHGQFVFAHMQDGILSIERRQQTALRYGPSLLSEAAGIGIFRDSTTMLIRDWLSAEPLARLSLVDTYSLVSLSPDGSQLAVIEHARAPEPEDSDQAGEPALHLFDLRTAEHWIWGRAPRLRMDGRIGPRRAPSAAPPAPPESNPSRRDAAVNAAQPVASPLSNQRRTRAT